ncbi:MAG: enolase C-terminal domain-like protein [Pseudomonadota bacterium]
MKIVRVRAIPMSDPVPPARRHRTDLGTKVKSDATLILVETDSGLTGMGTALGSPPVVAAIVDHELAPEVVGEDPLFSERIYENNIAWFEEPVSPDNHRGQAEVRRATTIPIASGEREFTRYGFQSLLQHDAIDIAQPDVARAGGFTEIRRIAALTSARDVRLAPHAWGSGILFAASIHVAMAAANCHILEVSQGYMPMMYELFTEPFDIRSDGTVHAPQRPGLGFTLRADALERFKYVEGPEYAF